MHARTGKESYAFLLRLFQIEHNDDASGLIFSQKTACFAADHHQGYLVLIGFHMDACTITCVSLHIDLSATHGVARCISCVPMDHDFAFVHRITDRILCIAQHRDLGSIQISTQRIAGDPMDGDIFVRHARRKKPLSAAAFYLTYFC